MTVQLESVNCGTCGAPLKIPETAQFVTCNHCQTSLVVRRMESITLTEKLEETTSRLDQTERRLAELVHKNEIYEENRRWERERLNYMIKDNHGNYSQPSAFSGVFVLIVTVIMGVGGSVISGGLSLLIIVFGFFALASSFNKSGQYEEAHRRHKQRLQEISRRHRESRERGNSSDFLNELNSAPTPEEFLSQLGKARMMTTAELKPGWALPLVWIFLTLVVPAQADVFEQHTSDYLREVTDSSDGLTRITLTQLHQLQPLSKTETTPAVVIRTSAGNWTKAAMTWAFRKSDQGMIPILTIERFVTYRNDLSDITVASGENVMLFEGFSYDFDIGQVVPEDAGGDLKFEAQNSEKQITLLDSSKLWGINGSQLPQSEHSDTPAPTDHSGVLPTDFNGVWKISVDGRWAGTMRLKVEKGRLLTGSLTSDETQSTYEVFGRVAAPPQHAKLTIQLDNAQQDLEAYLWTTDKSAMAGVSSLAGQSFGFYATRETEEK